MRAVLVALTNLVAPGFAQGLMRQRLPSWVAFGAMVVALSLLAVTVWAAVIAAVVFVGAAVDAGLRYRKLRGTIRWSWLDPLLVFGANLVFQILIRVFVIEAFKAPSTSMSPTLQLGDHFMINKLATSPSRGDIIVFRHPCQPEVDYIKRVIAVGGDTFEIRCGVVYVNGTALPLELIDAKTFYEDRDEGWNGRPPESYFRDASRYRETVDGTSYEVFHLPNQSSEPDASKDFPLEPVLRGCGYEQPTGKVVVTKEIEPDRCKPQMHFVVPDGTLFMLGDNRPNSNDSRFWGVVPLANVRGRLTGIWYPFSRFGGVR